MANTTANFTEVIAHPAKGKKTIGNGKPKIGNENNNKTITIVIVVILIVAGYFFIYKKGKFKL